jgi:hypothetical protein
MMLIKEFHSNIGGIVSCSFLLLRINPTNNMVLYARGINGDDKQEVHEALQRKVNYKKVPS